MREGPSATDSRLEWRWTHGSEIAAADFGDPQATTDYTFCIYDEDALSPTGLRLLANATTGEGNPNWTPTSRGFRYADQTLATDGLENIVLRSGAAGKSRIVVRGKGSNLSVTNLPAAPPIIAELRSSTGDCWRSQFTTIRRNTAEKMHARVGP